MSSKRITIVYLDGRNQEASFTVSGPHCGYRWEGHAVSVWNNTDAKKTYVFPPQRVIRLEQVNS